MSLASLKQSNLQESISQLEVLVFIHEHLDVNDCRNEIQRQTPMFWSHLKIIGIFVNTTRRYIMPAKALKSKVFNKWQLGQTTQARMPRTQNTSANSFQHIPYLTLRLFSPRSYKVHTCITTALNLSWLAEF